MRPERVDIVYSQQDEFRSRFRRLFKDWKWLFGRDGQRLGRLAFGDMRTEPGLQLADLAAYESMHYYHLRETRPDLAPRFPLAYEAKGWKK